MGAKTISDDELASAHSGEGLGKRGLSVSRTLIQGHFPLPHAAVLREPPLRRALSERVRYGSKLHAACMRAAASGHLWRKGSVDFAGLFHVRMLY